MMCYRGSFSWMALHTLDTNARISLFNNNAFKRKERMVCSGTKQHLVYFSSLANPIVQTPLLLCYVQHAMSCTAG